MEVFKHLKWVVSMNTAYIIKSSVSRMNKELCTQHGINFYNLNFQDNVTMDRESTMHKKKLLNLQQGGTIDTND